jgi:hypothetical protein
MLCHSMIRSVNCFTKLLASRWSRRGETHAPLLYLLPPRSSLLSFDIMKKPGCQLVLQFPCNSLQEFDAVVALEDTLIAELSGTLAHVDGHDSGSGEATIFILTSEPNETFNRARAVLGKTHLASLRRAAYRRLDAEEYVVLWPPGEARLTVA